MHTKDFHLASWQTFGLAPSQLEWEKKMFNDAALLDFPNIIVMNGLKRQCETSHFAAVVTLKKMYPSFYSHLFYNVSLWEKPFWVMVRDVLTEGLSVKYSTRWHGKLFLTSVLYSCGSTDLYFSELS